MASMTNKTRICDSLHLLKQVLLVQMIPQVPFHEGCWQLKELSVRCLLLKMLKGNRP